MINKRLTQKFREMFDSKKMIVSDNEYEFELEFTLKNNKKITNKWHSYVRVKGSNEEKEMVMRDNLMCTMRELFSRKYYDCPKTNKIVYFKSVRMV